jgi:hypothetical protein
VWTPQASRTFHCTFVFRTIKLSVKFQENVKFRNAKSIKMQHCSCGHLHGMLQDVIKFCETQKAEHKNTGFIIFVCMRGSDMRLVKDA